MLKDIIEKEEFSSSVLFDVCSKQLAINPNCYYTHYLLGRHHQDLASWDNAIVHFKKSLQSDCSKLGVWQGLHNSLLSYHGTKVGLEKLSTFINRELYKKREINELEELLLFRVVESKYVQNFTVEQLGRFSPTKSYRKPKSEGPWYDMNENRPHQAVKIENVKMPGMDVKFMELSIGGMYNILCFSHVTKTNLINFVENYDIKKFQEDEGKEYSVIVINNPKLFLQRVMELHTKMEFGEVYYLPQGVVERSNGILFPFFKDEEYFEEFEFRLATQHARSEKLNEAVFLDIGKIDDICDVIEPSELLAYVKERLK